MLKKERNNLIAPKAESTGKAFMWKLLERFGVAGAQFVLQIVLARLLSPDHYGVLSIMIIFTTLANVFIQNGFNTALIQNKEVKEEDYSSVLWLSLGIAGILYAVIYFVSPAIGSFYKMDDIVWPMRTLALMLFPGALTSVQLAKVSREMKFRKVFYSNMIGVVLSGVISIVIALKGGGLWALVAQTLINAIIVSVVMSIVSKLRIRLVCNFKRLKVLFSYGWKLLVSALLDALYQDANSLVIGKKYNANTLGYYNRGQQFPQLLINSINGSVQSVLLPAMSKEQDDKSRVKEMTRTSVTVSSYLVFPIMAGLAAVAPALIELLLTAKWLPSVPYLQICCITFAFYPIHSANLQAINAVGRSDIFLKLEIVKKAVGMALLVGAVVLFQSPIAIAVSAAIGVPFGLFINAFPNKKLINYSLFEQIKDIFPSLMIALLMFGGVWALNLLELNLFVLLLIQVVAGVTIYVALSVITKSKPFFLLLNAIKNRKKNKTQKEENKEAEDDMKISRMANSIETVVVAQTIQSCEKLRRSN